MTILAACRRVMAKRPPDFVIKGPHAEHYLRRWWLLPRNRFFNVYLHHFLHDDEDRALHDHMYVNLSWVLTGGYFEHRIGGGYRFRWPGSITIRLPRTAHRIALRRDVAGEIIEAITIFVTGPRVRNWGFYCPKGWVPWQEFVSARDSGSVGRGCE